MAEIIRVVCDRCGSEDDVAHYRVSTPDTGLNRGVTLDLCKKCGTPLVELAALGNVTNAATVGRKPAYRGSRRAPGKRLKIYTEEELDAHVREENS